MKHIQILNCVLTLHFSATSLANVELKWANEVKHFCKNVPIILIANKIDIRSDQNNLDELVRNFLEFITFFSQKFFSRTHFSRAFSPADNYPRT